LSAVGKCRRWSWRNCWRQFTRRIGISWPWFSSHKC